MSNRYVWRRYLADYTLSNLHVTNQPTTWVRSMPSRGTLSSGSSRVAYIYKTQLSAISYKKADETNTDITISSGTLVGQFNSANSEDVTIGGAYYSLTDIGNVGTEADENTIIFASDNSLSFPATIKVLSRDFKDCNFFALYEYGRGRWSSGFSSDNIDGVLKIEDIAGNEGYSRITAEGLRAIDAGDHRAYRFNAAVFDLSTAAGTANGTVSNSASSTYPPNDTQPRIASICVIPAILRRCKYVE